MSFRALDGVVHCGCRSRSSVRGVRADRTRHRSPASSWIRPKAAVPGASIAVINVGTNATTNVVSSESGTYSAANLPPGTYRIEATLQGFQTSKVEGVDPRMPGTTARVDVTLSLGSVSESVLVVAENAGRADRRREESPRRSRTA